jgi:hypothetical protein
LSGANRIHVIQAERGGSFTGDRRSDGGTRATGANDQYMAASDRMARRLQAPEAAQAIEILSMPVSVAPAADGID